MGGVESEDPAPECNYWLFHPLDPYMGGATTCVVNFELSAYGIVGWQAFSLGHEAPPH